MSDLNQVTLIGRLTRDAEVRGENVISMRIAVNGRSKQTDGSWADKAGFFDVVHFARSDKLAPLLVKGKQIGLSGRLSHREWVDREGGKRQSVEVIANDLFLLGGKESSGGGGSGGSDGEIPF